MGRRIAMVSCALALALPLVGGTSAAAPTQPAAVGRFIVVLRDDVATPGL